MRHIVILLLVLPVANAGLRGARDTLSALGTDEADVPKTEEERIQRLEKLSSTIDTNKDDAITTAELKVIFLLVIAVQFSFSGYQLARPI
jgi:hypothetical protein